MPDGLELCLLGGVTITLDGKPLELVTRKEAALLVYLACTNRPQAREVLAEQLWDERSARQSHSNLRTLLSRLRRSLGPFLTVGRDQIALNTEAGLYRLDVAEFTAHLSAVKSRQGQMERLPRAAADQLARALQLYRGDFLAGFHLRDARGFEEWADVERERLRYQAEEGFRHLVAFYLQRGQHAKGLESVSRLLALNPLDEEAHRQMMLLLAGSGQRGAALAQYRACRQILAQELGVEPSPETEALYARISARKAAFLTEGSRLPRGPAHNLPPLATPLVGRRDELSLLRRRLLDPSSRLVTIAGIGGVGKTRLALAAAEQVADEFCHGVWFVPLAEVEIEQGEATAGDILVQAIAQAIELTFLPGSDPRAQLLDALRSRELLLILDNLEQMQEAGVGLIRDLLHRAPYVTVLVTSRQYLNLQAEQAMRLEGLPVPAAGSDLMAGWDGRGEYPYSSVQLFVERANRRPSGFKLDQSNLADVVQVCRLAEGLPLGIELAASWTGEMDCAAIVRAIQENLDFLATNQQDVPERHRTLRAVLESSWQLLAVEEQRVLVQVALLGEFSQEAASVVAEATPAQLAALVSKSLLRRLGPGRYAMHTLLRQLAREKLGQLPSLLPKGQQELRARHGVYYLEWLAQRKATLFGARRRQAVEDIRSEMENIRLAWRWASEEGVADLLIRSSGALARFLRIMGLFREGGDLFQRAVSYLQVRAESVVPSDPGVQMALGWALVEQAGFSIMLAAYDQAIELARRGVELAQRIRAPDVEAAGRLRWGLAHLVQGNYPTGRDLLHRAVELAQEAGILWWQAEGLRHLGRAESELGSHTAARSCFEQAREIFVHLGDPEGMGTALDSLGVFAYDQAEFRAARSYYEQALAIFQETGYGLGQVSVLNNLGNVLMRLGDYAGAQARYEQALRILREMGGRLSEGLLISNLGTAVRAQGDDRAAYEYAHQALAFAQESGERRIRGYALGLLGNILADWGELQPAAAAYEQALLTWEELGQEHLMMSMLAGLARISLAKGDLAQACQHVDRILAYVAKSGAIPTTDDEEFPIYLTCYRTLNAAQDPRARDLLATAYTALQQRANQIADVESRRLFLENVPVHHEIVREWEEDQQHAALSH